MEDKSVKSALTEVLQEISEAFNNKKKISKTFDNTPHKVLFGKLEFYGIRGSALALIKRYLKNYLKNTLQWQVLFLEKTEPWCLSSYNFGTTAISHIQTVRTPTVRKSFITYLF